MHYPPKNYVNGLGFIGPPGAAQVTSGGIPIVSYTSSSGWAARPILATGYYQPTVIATGDPVAPQYDSGIPPPTQLPYAPGGLTPEQLQALRDQLTAAQQELLARQEREGGDGIATDLEQQAAEDRAREKAAAGGWGAIFGAPGEGPNWIPLAIAAGLIYFMAG